MGKRNSLSLKEFAASLFEEVEPKGHAGFGDGDAVHAGVNNTTTLKDETAHKKSGDAGGVEDPGKKDSLSLAESEDKELESQLMEMLNGMGEGEESSMGGDKKMALEGKLKALKEEEEKLMKELQECGMMGDGGSGAPVNVNLKITVDKEGEVADIKADTADAVTPSADTDMSVSDDEDDDLDLEITPDEDEEGEEEEMVTESKVSKEAKDLRNKLVEQQLMSAVSIYTAKVFAEHNLSRQAKQKIVKYFDSAQTLQEAKTRYGRVKTMLAESNKPTTTTVGSSSKPSVTGGNFVNENKNPLSNLEVNPNRWMDLAGIKVKR